MLTGLHGEWLRQASEAIFENVAALCTHMQGTQSLAGMNACER